MTQEHKMIFDMLKAGTISVEEAEKLMSAVPEGEQAGEGFRPKRLAVRVSEEGRAKINVRLPFALVRMALRLGQSLGGPIAKAAGGNQHQALVMEALKEIDLDEILRGLDDGVLTLPLTLVDVDVEEDRGKVNVLVVLE